MKAVQFKDVAEHQMFVMFGDEYVKIGERKALTAKGKVIDGLSLARTVFIEDKQS